MVSKYLMPELKNTFFGLFDELKTLIESKTTHSTIKINNRDIEISWHNESEDLDLEINCTISYKGNDAYEINYIESRGLLNDEDCEYYISSIEILDEHDRDIGTLRISGRTIIEIINEIINHQKLDWNTNVGYYSIKLTTNPKLTLKLNAYCD